jgi:hypothetical protein
MTLVNFILFVFFLVFLWQKVIPPPLSPSYELNLISGESILIAGNCPSLQLQLQEKLFNHKQN